MTDLSVKHTAPGGGLLGYATDAECISACLREIARLEAALSLIYRLRDWTAAKYHAAQRMGLGAAASRYWQRLVALEDAIRLVEQAG